LTLGLQMGDKIEVLAGLQVGDRLVTTGMNNLDDNSPVRVAAGVPQPTGDRVIREVGESATADTTGAAERQRRIAEQQRAN